MKLRSVSRIFSSVKRNSRAYLPLVNADVIKTDKGGSETDKMAKTKNEVDPTFKGKRILKGLEWRFATNVGLY